MNKLNVALIIMFLLTACNSREKRERALMELDAAQITLTTVQTKIKSLETTLNKNIVELEVAKDEVEKVKEFQFLRTEAERKQQIREATEYKLKIEENIQNLNTNIMYLKDSVRRIEVRIGRLKESLKD